MDTVRLEGRAISRVLCCRAGIHNFCWILGVSHLEKHWKTTFNEVDENPAGKSVLDIWKFVSERNSLGPLAAEFLRL